MRHGLWILFCCLAVATAGEAAEPAGQDLLPDDAAALQAAAGVVELFRKAPGELWPGYDLAGQPVLVYRPGRWAVLLNPPPAVAGFGEYPAQWPPLGVPARLQTGAVDGLVGQLAFDHDLGTCRTVAVPLEAPPGIASPAGYLFRFIIHEAFHQFQRTVFRAAEIPPEEQYPILDAENAARAALEMHILRDAVRAAASGDTAAARELAGMFIAVRRHRWERAAPAVRLFERGKEITEGTAQYVEIRAADRLGALCRSGASANPALCPELAARTAAECLADDFAGRLRDGALGPGDVARYRIYPVGAAIGFLLDRLGADWKAAAAALPEPAALADLLSERLGTAPGDPDGLRLAAEERYALDRIRVRGAELQAEYVRGFEEALAAFESRPGTRLAVELPAGGTGRSRSSAEPRWVMDEGRQVLGGFTVYVLKRPGGELFFQADGQAVLDELPAQGVRRVTCVVARIGSLTADGVALDPAVNVERQFGEIRLEGAGVRLEARLPGFLSIRDGRVAVRLAPTRG